MPANVKAWLFRSSSCCCCIPVRAGFVLMSVLTLLLSGAISVIIWFEISHSYQLSAKERVAFVLTGTVESCLFVASTVGFIGVVARKQLFVMIYAYFLYVHFVLNIIVGIYFLVTVRQSNRQQLVDYCSEVFVNTSVESSCSRLMSVSTYVFIAIVVALLLLELYGTLIVTRYVHRLRVQKRDGRSRRLGYFHALSKPESLSSRHARQTSESIELLRSRQSSSDPLPFEDAVLDIRPQSYTPLSTHDRDLPLAPMTPPPPPPPPPPPLPLLNTPPGRRIRAPLPPPPPSIPLLDTPPGRRIRALPPRPSVSPIVTTSHPQERATQRARLPHPNRPIDHSLNRHERQSPESDGELHSAYTSDVSTSAHGALMDHAAYIEPMFSNAPPAPKYSQRLLR